MGSNDATKPVARVSRGDKRKRRAVTPPMVQPSGERTILHKPITPRNTAADYLTAGNSRHEKLSDFEWSIISIWK